MRLNLHRPALRPRALTLRAKVRAMFQLHEAWFWWLLGGLLAYELAAAWSERPGDTISEIIWRVSATRSIVPFAAGMLAGHLFWR